MKKLFVTLSFFLAGICIVVAQTDNKQNNQNKPPQQVQPDMQKDTIVLLAGRFGGPIKYSDISKQDSLFMNKPGLKVIGFSLAYKIDTAFTKFDSRNNKLTSEMLTALKALKPGQNFMFGNIRCMASDGKVRKPTYDFIQLLIEKEN